MLLFKRAIVDWCDDVLESGRPDEALTGICANLADYMEQNSFGGVYTGSMLFSFYETFSEFSGDFLYPLDAKGVLYKNIAICKWSGEYGAKRLRLVKHIRDSILSEAGLL